MHCWLAAQFIRVSPTGTERTLHGILLLLFLSAAAATRQESANRAMALSLRAALALACIVTPLTLAHTCGELLKRAFSCVFSKAVRGDQVI